MITQRMNYLSVSYTEEYALNSDKDALKKDRSSFVSPEAGKQFLKNILRKFRRRRRSS